MVLMEKTWNEQSERGNGRHCGPWQFPRDYPSSTFQSSCMSEIGWGKQNYGIYHCKSDGKVATPYIISSESVCRLSSLPTAGTAA
jgi:hypothetical protein